MGAQAVRATAVPCVKELCMGTADNVQRLRAALGPYGESASDGALRCLLRGQSIPGTGLLKLAAFFARRYEIEPDIETCDIKRAASTYRRYTSWKESLRGVEEQVAVMEASGTCLFHGQDLQGLPLCWVRPALHQGGRHDLHSVMLFYDQLFERGCALADDASMNLGGGGPFVVVYDRRNLGFLQARRNAAECREYLAANADMARVWMDMFYCRFADVYIIGAGLFFWTCWHIARSFMTDETAQKLHVLRTP